MDATRLPRRGRARDLAARDGITPGAGATTPAAGAITPGVGAPGAGLRRVFLVVLLAMAVPASAETAGAATCETIGGATDGTIGGATDGTTGGTTGAATPDADRFGLWWIANDGQAQNWCEPSLYTPFQLHVTLHDASRAAVAGYELGLTLPWQLIAIQGDFLGGNNGGTLLDHRVIYWQPHPTGPVTDLSLVTFLLLAMPAPEPIWIVLGPATPSSLPGHDGPTYLAGDGTGDVIPGGYVGGDPAVFSVGEEPVFANASQTLTAVKALFR